MEPGRVTTRRECATAWLLESWDCCLDVAGLVMSLIDFDDDIVIDMSRYAELSKPYYQLYDLESGKAVVLGGSVSNMKTYRISFLGEVLEHFGVTLHNWVWYEGGMSDRFGMDIFGSKIVAQFGDIFVVMDYTGTVVVSTIDDDGGTVTMSLSKDRCRKLEIYKLFQRPVYSADECIPESVFWKSKPTQLKTFELREYEIELHEARESFRGSYACMVKYAAVVKRYFPCKPGTELLDIFVSNILPEVIDGEHVKLVICSPDPIDVWLP